MLQDYESSPKQGIEKEWLFQMIARQNLMILELPLEYEEIEQKMRESWEQFSGNSLFDDSHIICAVFDRMNVLIRTKYGFCVAYSCLPMPSIDNKEYYLHGLKVFYLVLHQKNNQYVSFSDQIKRLVIQSVGENLSLEEVARRINISPNYICRIFKEEVGETYRSYCIRIKMDYAASLLRNSNLRVNEIGTAVGYSDPAYFNKLFKKQYQCTPVEYRKKAAHSQD